MEKYKMVIKELMLLKLKLIMTSHLMNCPGGAAYFFCLGFNEGKSNDVPFMNEYI